MTHRWKTLRTLRQAAGLALAVITCAAFPAAAREETLQDVPSATTSLDATALETLPNGRSVVEGLAGLYAICPPRTGVDASLAAPERQSFYVPAISFDEVKRIAVLRGPGSAIYGAGDGGIMSVVVRSGDSSLSQVLERLQQDGKIEDLETDPCREYFPEPGGSECPPDENLMDLIVLALEKEYGGTTGGAGAVQVGPLPPSPIYDPGPRPGDEKGPTFVRTGAWGEFTLPVGELAGALQVEAAAGCESKTTVALAGGSAVTTTAGALPATTRPRDGKSGAAGTTTRGGGTIPPGPTPASKPKEPPPEGMKLCGPDVTDYVLGVLDFMTEEFSQWSDARQAEQCKSLFQVWKANGAWELMLFSPYDQPLGDQPKTQGSYFFQRFTQHCARPEPCQSSVEFLGRCMPAQVVNYIQWGAISVLCDSETASGMSHVARDTVIQLVWGRSLSPSPVFQGQAAMSHLGKEFIRDQRGLGAKKKNLQGLLDQYFKAHPQEMGFGLEECTCPCAKYEDVNFQNLGWGFKWGLEWFEKRGSELRKP